MPKHTSEGMEVVKFNALLVAKIFSIVSQNKPIEKYIPFVDTVKPVLSGHRIKRTVAEVPKFISLIYFK